MSETEHNTGTNIIAVLKAGTNTEQVALDEISMSGCVVNLGFIVSRQQVVTLQLFEDQGNRQYSPFSPISATIESVIRRSVQGANNYEVKLVFNSSITLSHGVAQAINQSQNPSTPALHAQHTKEDDSTDKRNKSVFVIPVTCHMCGQKAIPFHSLQRNTMAGQTNIFNVQQYAEALPGKEYCNYNLIRVTVCPACYFASGYSSDFVKDSLTTKPNEAPFDNELIADEWIAGIADRRKLVAPLAEGFFSEERTLEQALLSYDLAVLSSDAMLKAEEVKKERVRNYKIALKCVFYILIKAELLMSNNKPKEAEQSLKEALAKLEGIFPLLTRTSSIKAAFLMGMIGLYFEIPKTVGDSINFLQLYDKNNKVRFGTEEHKTLVSSLKSLREAYQSRSEFHRKNLNGFNKPFDF